MAKTNGTLPGALLALIVHELWGGGVRVRGKASLRWDDACVNARFDPGKRGISEVRSNSVREVRVQGGGLVGHVGLHAPAATSTW